MKSLLNLPLKDLLPPREQIQLRHHLHDTIGRQRDYLNHWDQLALELGRVQNPQMEYPKIIIGRGKQQRHRNSSTNSPVQQQLQVKCRIRNFQVKGRTKDSPELQLSQNRFATDQKSPRSGSTAGHCTGKSVA